MAPINTGSSNFKGINITHLCKVASNVAGHLR